MEQKMQQKETKEVAERTGGDPFIIGSMISIPLSWYYFYVEGNRERGLFVGLWAPTLLALGSYFRQIRMSEMMEQESFTVVRRVQDMLKEFLGEQ